MKNIKSFVGNERKFDLLAKIVENKLFKKEMCLYVLVVVEHKLHLSIICYDDDCSKIGTFKNGDETMLNQQFP